MNRAKKHKAIRKVAVFARKAQSHKKMRFALVGVVNTGVDFVALNLLVLAFGFGLVAANIVSTTCAMLISFVLNRRVVFQHQGPDAWRQFILFIVVTVAGIWLIQTIIVVQVYEMLESALQSTQQSGLLAWLILNTAKVVGVAVGIVWNYLWYSRFVFKGRQ